MPARHGTTLDDRPSTKTKRPGINLVQLVASACLAIALLALSGVATWSAFATSHAATISTRDGRLAAEYNTARFEIGAEESLERKYPTRAEPGGETRSPRGQDCPRRRAGERQSRRRCGRPSDRDRRHRAQTPAI